MPFKKEAGEKAMEAFEQISLEYTHFQRHYLQIHDEFTRQLILNIFTFNISISS